MLQGESEAYLWFDLRNESGEADVSSVELFFHQAPGNGSISISVDDGPENKISLDGAVGFGSLTIVGNHPLSLLKIRVTEMPVQLNGMFLNYRQAPAATLDSFGIPGATVRSWQQIDPVYFSEYFKDRKYDLVMLEYGTNEGNADMGVHLAQVHIACMGIEKILPRRKDLGVFLRLLARSATGQPITNYNSHFRNPSPGKEIHIILVDNGRTAQLAREKFRNSLKCIRCGACMNTCPIYRRSGGFSYNSTVPGPIGSILSPGLDLKKHSSLPFASTLCGSCTDVCPVKINIHEQLYEWRQEVTKTQGEFAKGLSMKLANGIFKSPLAYKISGSLMRNALKSLPNSLIYHPLNIWGKNRNLPDPPKESFQQWYRKNRS